MNSVVAAFPKDALHVIVDNLNIHKKNERWLKKHPNVHFHFTPTRASWLNQIETWFSILQGQSLSGASFTAVEQLQTQIDASSQPTTRPPSHSPGPRKRSASAGSKIAVSLNSDSGY
jgi:transposase